MSSLDGVVIAAAFGAGEMPVALKPAALRAAATQAPSRGGTTHAASGTGTTTDQAHATNLRRWGA